MTNYMIKGTMKNKTGGFKILLAMFAVMMMVVFGTVTAKAAGALTIAVSSQNVRVGDTVTVTVYAAGANNEEVTADMTVNYDSSVLQYSNSSVSGAAGGGGSVTARGSEVEITFKAIGAGTASVSAAAPTVTGAGVKITASGAADKSEEADANKSADNSLSAISLSAGTLSPAFSSQTTNYTVEVGADVTDLTVTPSTSNAKATIESITGNTGLKVGDNTIKILVKAENGAEATYTITVKKSETITETTPAETAPENGAEAVNTENNIEDNSGNTATVTQDSYDRLNEEYTELKETYESYRSTTRRNLAILIFVAVVLLILAINLLMKCHELKQDEDEEERFVPAPKKEQPRKTAIKREPGTVPEKKTAQEKKAPKKKPLETEQESDFEEEPRLGKKKWGFFDKNLEEDDAFFDEDDFFDDTVETSAEAVNEKKNEPVKEKKKAPVEKKKQPNPKEDEDEDIEFIDL